MKKEIALAVENPLTSEAKQMLEMIVGLFDGDVQMYFMILSEQETIDKKDIGRITQLLTNDIVRNHIKENFGYDTSSKYDRIVIHPLHSIKHPTNKIPKENYYFVRSGW